jgi:hypothetical protein
LAGEEIVLFLITLMLLAGIAVLLMAMYGRRRIRELEYRERIAMIERGLIPSPEQRTAASELTRGESRGTGTVTRTRSAGVILVGFGLGLMVLIAFAAGSPMVGFGIGGAFALLGGAFIVNAALASRDDLPLPPGALSGSNYDRPEPPRNIGP